MLYLFFANSNFNTAYSLEDVLKRDRLSQKNLIAQHNYFSQPNLWWATEQFDPFGGKLIESWSFHTQVKEINLIVNLQLWNLMDYLSRYSFVNQFGTTARNFGYSLNIFSTKKQRLATYRFNSQTLPPKWEITLERLGKDSLGVNSSGNTN